MKTVLRSFSLLILLAATAVSVVADDAPAATDPFRITLPEGYAAFAKQVQTAKSPEGDIETTNWVSRAPSGEAVVITMSKMPGKILDATKLFASTRESLLKSLGATLESEEKREGELESARLLFRSNAAFFRSRFVADEDRFYQLLYVGRSEEQRSNPQVAQIFESFDLVKTVAPEAEPATASATTSQK